MTSTLVIVDDHARFRASARALLEAAGFVVVGEAGTGTDGIAAVRRLRPDVVLLDITLPDMNGFEVAEVIGRTGPDPPLVVFTSTRALRSYGPGRAAGTPPAFIGKDQLSGASFRAVTGGSR